MAVRAIFTQVTVRWRTLQEFQRAAWVAAARDSKTDSRLGQDGPLTGAQLFTKINCTLARFGLSAAPHDSP